VLVQDPASLTALVTKRRQLPASYVPEGLALVNGAVRSIGEQRIRSVALDPLRRMVAEMNAAGLAPAVVSSYRSYATQEQTYAYWVRTLGQAQADRVSARPGHSEHQLGLAVDFGSPSTGYELEQTFAGTPEGRWLAANARRFGFIMSYPQGKEALTGYDFEPWHFRYVGAEAQAIADRGLTLEEYLAGR
jgi:D-alanyl-D-alanine carboxypeptidase